MNEVNSYHEPANAIKDKEKACLLLYKKGSEKSDCAYQNTASGAKDVKGPAIYYSDVIKICDIHARFHVASVHVLLEFGKESLKNLLKESNDATYYKALFEDTIYYTNTKNEKPPQKRVLVYSSPACSMCNTVKAYLKMHRVQFSDIDISKNQRVSEELVRRSGRMKVPQTQINGELIAGFNKVRINELLDIRE